MASYVTPKTPYYSAYRGSSTTNGQFDHFVRSVDHYHVINGYWQFRSNSDATLAHSKGFQDPESVLLAEDRGDVPTDAIELCWVPGQADRYQHRIRGNAGQHLRVIAEERMMLGLPASFRNEIPVYWVDNLGKLFAHRTARRDRHTASSSQLLGNRTRSEYNRPPMDSNHALPEPSTHRTVANSRHYMKPGPSAMHTSHSLISSDILPASASNTQTIISLANSLSHTVPRGNATGSSNGQSSSSPLAVTINIKAKSSQIPPSSLPPSRAHAHDNLRLIPETSRPLSLQTSSGHSPSFHSPPGLTEATHGHTLNHPHFHGHQASLSQENTPHSTIGVVQSRHLPNSLSIPNEHRSHPPYQSPYTPNLAQQGCNSTEFINRPPSHVPNRSPPSRPPPSSYPVSAPTEFQPPVHHETLSLQHVTHSGNHQILDTNVVEEIRSSQPKAIETSGKPISNTYHGHDAKNPFPTGGLEVVPQKIRPDSTTNISTTERLDTTATHEFLRVPSPDEDRCPNSHQNSSKQRPADNKPTPVPSDGRFKTLPTEFLDQVPSSVSEDNSLPAALSPKPSTKFAEHLDDSVNGKPILPSDDNITPLFEDEAEVNASLLEYETLLSIDDFEPVSEEDLMSGDIDRLMSNFKERFDLTAPMHKMEIVLANGYGFRNPYFPCMDCDELHGHKYDCNIGSKCSHSLTASNKLTKE